MSRNEAEIQALEVIAGYLPNELRKPENAAEEFRITPLGRNLVEAIADRIQFAAIQAVGLALIARNN